MSETPKKTGKVKSAAKALLAVFPHTRTQFRAAAALLMSLFVRTYAFAILLVLLWAGYLAVNYLVRTVFLPAQAPQAMLQWQGKLDVSALRMSNQSGVENAPPRSPIGHYHGVDRWFQRDLINGCTLAGCHEPLPHTLAAKVPAFANFHTQFLECQMCHTTPAKGGPAPSVWISTESGRPTEVPAILHLMNYLDANADAIKSDPRSVSPTIVSSLAQAIKVLGGDALLDDLLAQIETTQPGSPVWKNAVIELQAELPMHARGEYRAKLAWKEAGIDWADSFASIKSQAREYLALPKDSPRRQELHQSIHAGLVKEPATCLTCHGDQPGALDFTAAGYSAKRGSFLSHLEVARLMQQIRQGEHFYIPTMMEAGHDKP